MTGFASTAYVGQVVHKRLAPRAHGFTYKVFTFCLDVDEIDKLAGGLKLFSRNRWNLVSFHDADHGAGDGVTVGDHARALLRQAGLGHCCARIRLVCYPRLLGYVFNPLSVYFAYDDAGRLGAIVYEVTNTLGERRSYVIPLEAAAVEGTVSQQCQKGLYVSPFTAATGSYGFHVVPPGERIVVGVSFREGGTPVLKTHFRGDALAISDRAIAGLMLRYPLMTMKVFAAIHFEAFRLWLKGVPIQAYFASKRFSFTFVDEKTKPSRHV